jgi:hypothetical protein
VIFVPRGAVASAEEWSLSEALDIFVRVSCDRALFTPAELPADAVAVLEAYYFANALFNHTIGGWLTSTSGKRPVSDVARGLRLIGESTMAERVEAVAAVRQSAASEAAAIEAMQRLEADWEWIEEEHLIRQCSDWVRHSPLTVVLGDGALDTVYKQVMQQLFRCNAHYAERKAAEDEVRMRMGLQPKAQLQGTLCTLDQLIAEMQRLHG